MPFMTRRQNIKGHLTFTLRMLDRHLGRLLRSVIRTTFSVPFMYFISCLNIMSSSRPDPHKCSVLPYKKVHMTTFVFQQAVLFFASKSDIWTFRP